MDSSTSSPHSSNSISHPTNLPLGPSFSGPIDSLNPPQNVPEFEFRPNEFQTDLFYEGSNENQDLRASWESLIASASISSFINSKDR